MSKPYTTPSTSGIFGASPVTRPMFAFGILLGVSAALQIFAATFYAAASSSPGYSAGWAALAWIAAVLYLFTGIFACIVAAKNKNSRLTVGGSISLAVFCAATLFASGGIFAGTAPGFARLSSSDTFYLHVLFSFVASIGTGVFSTILVGFSVAHASLSVRQVA